MAQIIWKPRAIRQLKVVFRYCTLRKRHKLIYHYSEAKDTVYIDDIWDMKMNPKTLRKRFE